ncbi:TIGR04282 family arsenosugar biosynthesis glycosyltransferase [Pseudotamlana agarivorans]|uniref:TIGR04282 family arsenosugar biosynthesis glycosyltransferase n=1 Tax=Pseudotamlana agarivorans TaxID=481183 RepID=UPI000831A269|nr:TIGR04282 family arsenosugar biosynthesis glycosyltransferase [Tamlana agarivorans]
MNKALVIVFVKNAKPGKVKTRLAKTIGNEKAVEIYQALLEITERATENILTDVSIHYSEFIDNSLWKGAHKTTQQGQDLGERMKNAFQNAFQQGYQRVVLIGSDLPSLTNEHLNNALENLLKTEVVFGPAQDGGYYLVGLSKMHACIFENKPWSQTQLLEVTLQELSEKNISVTKLETLNDIDTFEDLKPYQHLLKLLSSEK